jgi:hypothetical protein
MASCDLATGKVMGLQTARQAVVDTAVPADTFFVLLNATQFAAAREKLREVREDGRGDSVTYNPPTGGEKIVTFNNADLNVPADTRPCFATQVDKTEIDADGVDQAVIDFARVVGPAQPTTVVTGYNGTIKIRVNHDGGASRLLKLVFSNGTCQKIFKTTRSGIYTYDSRSDVRWLSKVTIEAVE